LKELLTSVYIARRQTVDYRVAFLYASIEPTPLKQPFRRLRSFGDFNACVRHELMPILSENFAMFFKELLTSVYIARRQTVDYRVAFLYASIEPTRLRQPATSARFLFETLMHG
jgi:hypothetical protein